MRTLLLACLLLAPVSAADPDARMRILVGESLEAPRISSDTSVEIRVDGRSSGRMAGPFTVTLHATDSGLLLGKRLFRSGRLDLHPAPGELIQVGQDRYRDPVRFHAGKGGVDVILLPDLETYVAGVLRPEMGKTDIFQALRVQAVCARTYALHQRTRRRAEGRPFDLYGDTRDQVFRNPPRVEGPVRRAVESTTGEILTWKHEPIKTYFSSTCGGHTESVADWSDATEIPPLSGVSCTHCRGTKYYRWEREFTPSELGEKLGLRGSVHSVAIPQRTRSGRAARLVVTDDRGGRHVISGTDFRSRLGTSVCRSTLIEMNPKGRIWVLSGRGWGHGVGLCQMGALEMARRGATYREILAHYYPESEISLHWKVLAGAEPR